MYMYIAMQADHTGSLDMAAVGSLTGQFSTKLSQSIPNTKKKVENIFLF